MMTDMRTNKRNENNGVKQWRTMDARNDELGS
jgi:hypothetical protein